MSSDDVIEYDFFSIKKNSKPIEAVKKEKTEEKTEEKNTKDNEIAVKMFRLEDNSWIDMDFIGVLKVSLEPLATHSNLNQDKSNFDTIKEENKQRKVLCLKIQDIDNEEVTVTHFASTSIKYEREGTNIITWTEGGEEMALSFEKKENCDYVFQMLSSIDTEFLLESVTNQKNLESQADTEKVLELKSEDFMKSFGGSLQKDLEKNISSELQNKLDNAEQKAQDNVLDTPRQDLEALSFCSYDADLSEDLDLSSFREVVRPTIENIDLILHRLFSGLGLSTAKNFMVQSYLDQIFDTHSQLEDFSDFINLEKLFIVFKTLFLKSNYELTAHLLSEKNIDRVIGVLEYSYENIKIAQKENKDGCFQYRNYLSRSKQKIPPTPFPKTMGSVKIKTLVAHIHKLVYFKDVVFSQHMDDFSFRAINLYIGSKYETLALELFSNGWIISFLSDISTRCLIIADDSDASNASDSSFEPLATKSKVDPLREPLLFLKELFAMIKQLPIAEKMNCLDTLLKDFALLKTLDDVLTHASPEHDEWCWLLAVEILETMATMRGYFLRRFADGLYDPHGDLGLRLFPKLVKIIVSTDDRVDEGLLIQVSLLVQKTLESESEDVIKESLFLNKFASFEVSKIINAISMPLTSHNAPEKVYQCCEILSVLVGSRPFPLKIVFLSRAVFKVLPLLEQDDMRLKLSVLRFLRACLMTKDPLLVKNVALNDTMSFLVDLVERNGKRENLLSSALQGIFDYVRRENLTVILDDLRNRFRDRMLKTGLKVFRLIVGENSQEKSKKDKRLLKKRKRTKEGNNQEINLIEVKKPKTQKLDLTSEDIYFSENTEEDLEDFENERKVVVEAPEKNGDLPSFIKDPETKIFEKIPKTSDTEFLDRKEFEKMEIRQNEQNKKQSSNGKKTKKLRMKRKPINISIKSSDLCREKVNESPTVVNKVSKEGKSA